MKLNNEAERIQTERIGKDNVFALATAENGVPSVRYINASYENGAFYSITYALSNKIRQIEKHPTVALAGEWFTAHGTGEILGFFGKEENRLIARKLKSVFQEWLENGHTNLKDENTVIR